MSRLFGTDGIRGEANGELTPEMILDLGRSLAVGLTDALTHRPVVVVGRDPRPSGDFIEHALIAGLCSAGVDVQKVGVVPTAGIAFLTRHLGADAGVAVTASHNPLPDNGLKFFDRHGFKYSDEAEIGLETAVSRGAARSARPKGLGVGRLRHVEQAGAEAYLDHLLCGIPGLAGMAVTVDCANGAAAHLAPEAYRRAGATVREIASDGTGDRINDGVGATNPDFLLSSLGSPPGGIGLAHDGDADRLIAVDEDGVLVDGADLLAIFGVDMASRGVLHHNTIVTTPMSNSGLAVSMARHGITVVESAIGDRSVLRTMVAGDFVLGGEQLGHVIMLEHATTGDGILAALHMFALMARTGRELRELRTVWDRAPQVVLNVSVPSRDILDTSPSLRVLVERERAGIAGDGRLIVRLSTIEPVVRIVCEAPTWERCELIARRVQTALCEEIQGRRAEALAGAVRGRVDT